MLNYTREIISFGLDKYVWHVTVCPSLYTTESYAQDKYKIMNCKILASWLVLTYYFVRTQPTDWSRHVILDAFSKFFYCKWARVGGSESIHTCSILWLYRVDLCWVQETVHKDGPMFCTATNRPNSRFWFKNKRVFQSYQSGRASNKITFFAAFLRR